MSPFPQRRWRAAALAALACALAAMAAALPAQAMTLRELRALELSDKKQGGNYVRYYLVGVMEGVLEAHAQGVRQGARPVICLDGRRLEPRMAQELFESELRRGKDVYEADMGVPLVLEQALSTVYPC